MFQHQTAVTYGEAESKLLPFSTSAHMYVSISITLRPLYFRRKNHGSTLDPKPVWTRWQKNVCRRLNPRPINSVE